MTHCELSYLSTSDDTRPINNFQFARKIPDNVKRRKMTLECKVKRAPLNQAL